MIAEWTISLLALIVSVVFFMVSFTFPDIPADPAGLSLFPQILCALTGAGSALLIIQLWMNRRNTANSPVLFLKNLFYNAWVAEHDNETFSLLRRMTMVICFSVFYPWLIVRAGFLISTAVYSFILMKLFKTKTVLNVVISIAVAAALYIFFARLLEAYVPPGIWIEDFFE